MYMVDYLFIIKLLKSLHLTKIPFIKRYAERQLFKEAVKVVGCSDVLTVKIETED